MAWQTELESKRDAIRVKIDAGDDSAYLLTQLADIADALATGTGGTGTGGGGLTQPETTAAVKTAIETATTNGVSTVRAPVITISSTSGTVASGCRSLSMAVSGSASVTILGVSIPAGVALDFPVPSKDTLGAVSYNATGSQLIIVEVR